MMISWSDMPGALFLYNDLCVKPACVPAALPDPDAGWRMTAGKSTEPSPLFLRDPDAGLL